MSDTENQKWTRVIESRSSLWSINLAEVWRYRDLIFLLVKRDFITVYKQTILGPLWLVIQPILTTITFVIIFGNLAKISTDGIPMVLFYLAGNTIWGYFSSTLTSTSNVFVANASVFGKVYFPRLVMPLAIVCSAIMRFAIQFLLFLLFFFYYWLAEHSISPNAWVLATPLLIVLMATLALGLGMIFSSLTTKYRDLVFLLTFGIQLFMYATPVIYPISIITNPELRSLILLNPMTGILECFRYAFLGKGAFEPWMLLYTAFVSFVILAIGTLIFNKVEKSFMDTV